MGSCGEARNKGIDTSAGALVWVRRRNGSWWPGLVMSPEGLPRRRKGMPVKLLGKEDGSMDWYDLEKSKRIKAFRCGEYDECIKKAKAYAGRASRIDRAGKYARREEAIIHALEIEQIRNSSGEWDFYSSIIQSSCRVDKQGTHKEQTNIRSKKAKAKGKMITEVSPSVNSPEQHNEASVTNKVQAAKKRKWRNLNDNGEGGVEEKTRIRGLEDFGLGVKSRSVSGIINGMKSDGQEFVDDLSVTGMNFSGSFSCTGTLNPMKDLCFPKRGRREMQSSEVSKRKNRRRPLTKVLESTARVILPSSCSQEGSPRPSELQPSLLGSAHNKFATLDSSESKKTDFSVVINNSSEYSENSCGDVSGAGEVSNGPTVDEACFPLGNELSSTLATISDGLFDDLFEVPVLLEENYGADFCHRFCSPKSENVGDPMEGREPDHFEAALPLTENNLEEATCASHKKQRSEKILSKWHAKGRRNIFRATSGSTKETTDASEPLQSRVASHSGVSFSCIDDRIIDNPTNKFLESKDGVQQMRCGLVSSMLVDPRVKQTPEVPDIACTSAAHICESNKPVNCTNAEYENSPHNCNETTEMHKVLPRPKIIAECLAAENMPRQNLDVGNGLPSSSNLFEVKVVVQATYKGPHVPLIYLTSKVSGKAIIGHPLAIQIMESDSSDALMLNQCLAIDDIDLQGQAAVSKEAMDMVDAPLFRNRFSSINGKRYRKKSQKKDKRRYRGVRQFSSSSRKKQSSKVRKPKILPRKIRKLSSITVDRGAKEKASEQMIVGKLEAPVVSCIPVKLVFSRISEALGCS